LLDDTVSPATPLYLVANKLDLIDAQVVHDDLGEQFAVSHKAQFYRTSALTGEGVNELFQDIATDMLKSKEGQVESDKKGIAVYATEEKKCGC
jgi:GTPase SAR1 family protein